MPTDYRPTERRGKRVVYKSTDPDEPKRDRSAMIVFIGVVAFFTLIATAITHWVK